MSNLALTAISPIDGRYSSKTSMLSPYFSEYGLIKYRVRVEIEYFIALYELPVPQLQDIDKAKIEKLRDIVDTFSEEDAETVKTIERTTNHDVKAVEYFIKEEFDKLGLQDYKEFIHFGLTSQDINNTAVPLSIKDATEIEFMPALSELILQLDGLAKEWADIPMLAKTHGQPASPTRLGKEICVFVSRLNRQVAQLVQIPYSAKFGGATGNLNAHKVTYPEINWIEFAHNFVDGVLGLEREPITTQISNYDNLSAYFDCLKRINTILIDLCRDIWTYVSMEYFKQKIKKGEIGSSAMPHKVNPIDFENAEGNLGIANAVLEHLSQKLPVSRLQRDLTDSTVLRNVGVPMGHMMISIASMAKGFGKLLLNEDALDKDLENNWAVVAEAIQSILRREGYPKPYETLLALTRKNTKVTRESISDFIETLNVSEEVKTELRAISPQNYTGILPE